MVESSELREWRIGSLIADITDRCYALEQSFEKLIGLLEYVNIEQVSYSSSQKEGAIACLYVTKELLEMVYYRDVVKLLELAEECYRPVSYTHLPRTAGEVILIVLVVLTALDLAGTLTGILKVKSHVKKQSLLYGVSENLQKTADTMGKGLTRLVLRRMERAYPSLNAGELLKARREQEQKKKEAREGAGVFARGCSFLLYTSRCV